MNEQWRAIPDFPGYEVSDYGRVRSFNKRIPNGVALGAKWEVADKPQRYLAGATSGGYRFVILRKDGESHNRRIHNLVLLSFVGPCPDGMEICHNDGHKVNNNLGNLRYDTHRNNVHDAMKHGKYRPAISDSEAVRIRKAYTDGTRQDDLAIVFGVSPRCISRVCSGVGVYSHFTPLQTLAERKYQRAIKIHQLRRQGKSLSEISREVGITSGAISRIVNGQSYSSLVIAKGKEPSNDDVN